jgi:hypothetical protein
MRFEYEIKDLGLLTLYLENCFIYIKNEYFYTKTLYNVILNISNNIFYNDEINMSNYKLVKTLVKHRTCELIYLNEFL